MSVGKTKVSHFLKVVANEKGEASGAVLNIRCCMVRELVLDVFLLFYFNGLPSFVKSNLFYTSAQPSWR
jgi:hypothetical protein